MIESLLTQLLLISAAIERAVQFIKNAVPYSKRWPGVQAALDVAISVVLGVVVAFWWRVDVFALAGLSLPAPWLGAVLTGAVSALGSNVLHDLAELVKLLKPPK